MGNLTLGHPANAARLALCATAPCEGAESGAGAVEVRRSAIIAYI